MKTLLSLFDYSGQWSAPFADAGWTVVQVDIKHGHDIKKFNAKWLIKSLLQGYPTINGILGAPPGVGAAYVSGFLQRRLPDLRLEAWG